MFKKTGAVLLLVLAVFAATPAMAQDSSDDGQKLDKITLDFVEKPIQAVIHFIALKSGIKVIVQGTVEVQLTVFFKDVDPMDAIRSICTANQLDMVEDGDVIIIKTRVSENQLANVVAANEDKTLFNVSFEGQPLVAAIMEVAKVTRTNVFVPSVPNAGASGDNGGNQPPDGGQGGGGPQQEDPAKIVKDVQQREISMYLRNGEAVKILQHLGELGDMKVEVKEDGVHFAYKLPQAQRGPIGDPGMGGDLKPEDFETGEWQLPGANMQEIQESVTNLLSTYGKIVVDPGTSYLWVKDVKTNMEDIRNFLDKVQSLTAVVQEEARRNADDPMMVKEYVVIRDVESTTLNADLGMIISEDGRVTVNPDHNSILVYDHRSRFPFVDEWIASLDQLPDQVLIQSKIVEVTLEDYMGYGLEWFTSQDVPDLGDGVATGSNQDTVQGTVGGLFGQPTGFDPIVGTFTNSRVDFRLELLANDGKARQLSRPHTMVTNRQTARINVGQEVPYLESTQSGAGGAGAAAVATVAFRDVAIELEVTPIILKDNLVRLRVQIGIRDVIGNVAIEGNNTPIISVRESNTDVFIRDGETLGIGGLMKDRERMDENGLPFLKDIPFLGYLFKSANISHEHVDLLIFLTPHVVAADMGNNGSRENHVDRDLRPILLDKKDAKDANIRDGRWRMHGTESKPKHYNEKSRPKKPTDVKPGA